MTNAGISERALGAAASLGALPVPVFWVIAALAVALVFGVGRHILTMALQALRRGILNQHVLLEAAALAGLGFGAWCY